MHLLPKIGREFTTVESVQEALHTGEQFRVAQAGHWMYGTLVTKAQLSELGYKEVFIFYNGKKIVRAKLK